MARSNPRVFYGVHSWTPYRRSNGLFYGTIEALKGSSLALSGETVDLIAGSSKYPIASEDGAISSEMTVKPAEFPDFLFELFLGKAPTAASAETTGNVSTLTNKYGSSVMHATTGIASVGKIVGSEADLKFGKYVVKAITSTTVMVYFSSSADLGRGTDKSFEGDNLEILSAAVTITASTDTNLTGFGLKLAGGSGVIGMTAGDTATFEVRPINSKSMSVDVGGISDTFPEFGSIVMGQKLSSDELVEIDAPRCKGIGMPLNFEEKAFNESEIKVKLLRDTTLNKVFTVRTVVGA